MRAIVVGGGIGGLSAAIGLHRRGWAVTVLERAARFGEVGAGVAVQVNGLRALDALGVGDAVRAAGRDEAAGGLRTSTGRWISRVDGPALNRMLGGASAVAIHRATLHAALRAAAPAGSLVADAEVLDIAPGVRPVVRYRHAGQDTEDAAELVVAADGINSIVRRRLFPAHPGPVHSGATAWRGVTRDRWDGEPLTSLSWGPGAEFGAIPLGDGRLYWWGAVNAPAGERAPGGDEMTAVRDRFGHWHSPISAVLDATDPAAVIRTDLCHLATPLPSYVDGSVALLGDAAHAMTPYLGQGACQAIEDAAVLASVCGPGDDVPAALARYDALRRPRSQRVARASYQTGRIGQQLHHPLAVRLRNAALWLTPPRAALRSMIRYVDWEPPTLPAAPNG